MIDHVVGLRAAPEASILSVSGEIESILEVSAFPATSLWLEARTVDHSGVEVGGAGRQIAGGEQSHRLLFSTKSHQQLAGSGPGLVFRVAEGFVTRVVIKAGEPGDLGSMNLQGYIAEVVAGGALLVTPLFPTDVLEEGAVKHVDGAELFSGVSTEAEAQEPRVSDSAATPTHHFERLSVHGYRGFAAPGEIRLAVPKGKPGSGLSILVGANNSGKSTFIEALHYISRSLMEEFHSFPLPRRNLMTDVVELKLTTSDGASLVVRSLGTGGSQARSHYSEGVNARRSLGVYVTPSSRNFNHYFSPHYGSDERSWFQQNHEVSRTQSRDAFVARLQAVTRDEQRQKQFNVLLERIIGEPLLWTIDELADGQQYLRMSTAEGWHTSEGLGEGLISLLFIVDALYDSQPGALIAIDEPEASLHPQLIKRLRKVLSEFSADRQILISTHSPLLIDWTDVMNGATVARVHKNADVGGSRVSQASAEALQTVAKLGDHRNHRNPHTVGAVAREAFFQEDGVVLVEGQDDVAYMPIVLRDLELEEADSLFGWGSGGAENVPKLVELLLELGFKRIGALLDSDKAGLVKTLNSMSDHVRAATIPAPDIRYKAAVPAKEEIIGLLKADKSGVREEFREDAKRAIAEVFSFTSATHP